MIVLLNSNKKLFSLDIHNKFLETKRIKNYFRESILVLGLLGICIILSLTSPYFLNFRNIMNVLGQISMIGICAIGTTFVIISGGIDLSPGSIAGLSGVLAVSFQSPTQGFGWNVGLSWIIVLIIGAGLGAINGIFITKGKLPPFIATLCMMSIARGMAYVYTWATPVGGLKPLFRYLSLGKICSVPVLVIILFIFFIIFGLVLSKNKFGTQVYAIGGNEVAAWLSGINTVMVKIKVYILAGFFAAISGIILAARVNSGDPSNGQGLELDAIASVVMGGTKLGGGKGGLFGTFIGALIIGVINNGLNLLNVSPFYQPIVKALVILIAVLAERRKS